MVCNICKNAIPSDSIICPECGLYVEELDINNIIIDDEGPYSRFSDIETLMDEFITIYKSMEHENILNGGKTPEASELFALNHLVLSYIMQNYKGSRMDKHIISFFKSMCINKELDNADKYYRYWLINCATNGNDVDIKIELARRYHDGKYGFNIDLDKAFKVISKVVDIDNPNSLLTYALICDSIPAKGNLGFQAMEILFENHYNQLRLSEQLTLMKMLSFWTYQNFRKRDHMNPKFVERYKMLELKLGTSQSEKIIDSLYCISCYLVLICIDFNFDIPSELVGIIKNRFYSYDNELYKYCVLFNFTRAMFFQYFVLDTQASLKFMDLVDDELIAPQSNVGIAVNATYISTLCDRYGSKFFDYNPRDCLDFESKAESVEEFTA